MIRYRTNILLLLLSFTIFYGCNDEINEHYKRSANLPTQTVMDILSKNSSLSVFTNLVRMAGYDTLLSGSQAYTVFAPLNSSLSQIDLSAFDKDKAMTFVANHIARFNISTSVSSDRLVRMKNYKLYAFNAEGSSFGESEIVEKDILAKNGIVHVLNGQIPYRNNIFEYINGSDNTGKLSAFINRFKETRFDESLSIPIDIDGNGRTVYDSVKTVFNRLFDGYLGSINNEDSIYTMVIPTDNAWNEAYAKYFAFFKTYNANQAIADSIQNIQTSLAILNDLVYKGRLDVNSLPDSITSTSGSVIHSPAALLNNSIVRDASNGKAYFVEQLNYTAVETWNKKIAVECEQVEGRVAGANTGINTRIVDAEANMYVSESRYIEVVPSTTTAQPAVTFDIPNVMSGKYDVYVECLPGSIDGLPADSTRLLFDLTYLTNTGKTTNITVKENAFVTSGTKKVRIKAFSAFQFPMANYYDRLWWIDYKAGKHNYSDRVVTTKLLVKTNVTTTELNKNLFTRKFRIDRIVFEPVSN